MVYFELFDFAVRACDMIGHVILKFERSEGCISVCVKIISQAFFVGTF